MAAIIALFLHHQSLTQIELELLQLQARQATTTWNSISYQAWSLNNPFQFCLQPACYLVHTQLRAHPKLRANLVDE